MTGPTSDELKAFAAKHLPTMEVKPPADPLLSLPKRHVCVALLSYDAKMFIRSAMALTIAAARCGQLGWGFSYVLRESDSMVARGRSQLASRFLTEEGANKWTDLVFIDTDVYWDGDDLIKLLSHDVDVVAGAYPFKNESGNFPLRWSSQGLVQHNGLWVVQAATAGFMRIRRSALERIVAEMPWLEYTDAHGDASHRCWMFFDNLHRQTGIYDESYVFCERFRGCGGTIYIDPTIHLKHIGLKIYDHGTLEQWNVRKTDEVAALNQKYPNVDVRTLFNSTQGVKVDLEKEQADAVKAGAPRVILAGVENRKLEGDDVEEERPTPEVQPSPTDRAETLVEPGGQPPPPGTRTARKGANGAAVQA
jgi:hypothetical protein